MRWNHKPRRFHRRRLRLRVVSGLFLLSALLYGTAPHWLTTLSQHLLESDRRVSTTYGVVLAGEFPSRQIEAALAYREGRVKKIFLTREIESTGFAYLRAQKLPEPNAQERAARLLAKLGVPPQDLLLLQPEVGNTQEEALLLQQWFRQNRLTKEPLLVFTSPAHSRRAGIIFRDVFAADQQPIFMRANRFESTLQAAWWKNTFYLREVILEYEKILLHLLFRR